MEVTTEKNPFVEEQREWLISYREQTGMSWADLARRTGIAQGTISQFGSARGYKGKELPLAETVERFRQSLAQQADLDVEVPDAPTFYATDTTEKLERMLGYAQRGLVVAAALEAGCSKTTVAKRFSQYPNVIYVCVKKSAGAPNNLMKLIRAALGARDASTGTFDMSEQIVEQFKKMTKPLLIIDEAQHLIEASLEEVRSWNDEIGVGIALFGNVGVLQKLSRYAQLYSRIQLKLQRRSPLPEDVEAMLDAWDINDPAIRSDLRAICAKLGGLRNGTNTLNLAWMIAASESKALNVDHVRAAWQELDFRAVAA